MFYFSRGEQIGLVLLIAALVGAGGAMWWVGSHAGASTEPFFVDAPTGVSGQDVLVHVCGAVAKPGLYKVKAGTRVYEAIKLAGGATPQADLTAVNEAAEVEDGQQLYLPATNPAAPARPRAAAAPAARPSPNARSQPPRPAAHAALAPGQKVNINRAGVNDFDLLPGIGPTYAKRIVEYRQRLKAETGQGFTRAEQLMEVPGIGPKRFAEIKERVTL